MFAYDIRNDSNCSSAGFAKVVDQPPEVDLTLLEIDDDARWSKKVVDPCPRILLFVSS